MTFDTITNGVKDTQRLTAPAVVGRTALDSLLMVVDQEERRASVYVNCKLQGSVNLPWIPREMANDGDEDLRAVSKRREAEDVSRSHRSVHLYCVHACLARSFSELNAYRHHFPAFFIRGIILTWMKKLTITLCFITYKLQCGCQCQTSP